MKYIKTYETKNIKYKIGDYVLLDKKIIEDEDLPDTYALIYNKFKGAHINGSYYFYDVKFPNSKGDHDGYEVEYSEIIRKLTPEEIQEYNIKKDSMKYNL